MLGIIRVGVIILIAVIHALMSDAVKNGTLRALIEYDMLKKKR